MRPLDHPKRDDRTFAILRDNSIQQRLVKRLVNESRPLERELRTRSSLSNRWLKLKNGTKSVKEQEGRLPSDGRERQLIEGIGPLELGATNWIAAQTEDGAVPVDSATQIVEVVGVGFGEQRQPQRIQVFQPFGWELQNRLPVTWQPNDSGPARTSRPWPVLGSAE